MGEECPYFSGAPDAFEKNCDVLLKLDDGSELPAHTHSLARYSSVFANMLDGEGPLSSASTSKKAQLPLTDCTKATAISFLSVIYSDNHFEYIKSNRDCSMAIASLAHRLDNEAIVKICDDVISGAAGPSPTVHNHQMSSAFLQDRDLKAFKELMSSAIQFGMRKVLACCEHSIASDKAGKFDEMLQAVPLESFVRIVKCLRHEDQYHPLSPEMFLNLP